MDVDLELRFQSTFGSSTDELKKSLATANFQLSVSAKADAGLIARRHEDPLSNVSLDEVVRSFLSGLESYSGLIRVSGGTMRIGIFYNLSETIVFPFRLSHEAVRMISDLGLAIDATGYPCSGDDDEEEE